MIFLTFFVIHFNLTGQNGEFDNPNVSTICWQNKSSLYKERSRKTVIVSLKTKLKSADEIIGAIDWTVDT